MLPRIFAARAHRLTLADGAQKGLPAAVRLSRPAAERPKDHPSRTDYAGTCDIDQKHRPPFSGFDGLIDPVEIQIRRGRISIAAKLSKSHRLWVLAQCSGVLEVPRAKKLTKANVGNFNNRVMIRLAFEMFEMFGNHRSRVGNAPLTGLYQEALAAGIRLSNALRLESEINRLRADSDASEVLERWRAARQLVASAVEDYEAAMGHLIEAARTRD